MRQILDDALKLATGLRGTLWRGTAESDCMCSTYSLCNTALLLLLFTYSYTFTSLPHTQWELCHLITSLVVACDQGFVYVDSFISDGSNLCHRANYFFFLFNFKHALP